MLGLPLKKAKKQKKTFLTVDIGSQTVKCLAFKSTVDETDKQHPIKVVGLGKEWLEPWSVRSGTIIEMDNVVKALDAAIFKATEEIEENIDDVIFGVSGDVSTCMVTTARVYRKKPDKEITTKELGEIEAKLLNTAITNAQSKISKKTGDMETSLELITTAIVSSKLDGTEHASLEGLTGRTVEMALFNVFTPKYYLKTLEDLASILNLNILAVTSNLYAISESLKKGKKNSKLDCVIVDFGSDTTDIAVAFGGGIVTSNTLNMGGRQFTRHISNKTGLNFAEAEKRKYDYTFGKLDEKSSEELEIYLEEVSDIWLSGMELLFNNFEGVKTFSSDIYLTGGGSKLPLVTEFLREKPWTKSIPFKEPPTFNKLTAKDIAHVLDTTGEADKEEFIIPLALSSIYLELRPTK